MAMDSIMKHWMVFVLFICARSVLGYFKNFSEPDLEDQRINMIVDLITFNLKNNGWNTVLCYGDLPDVFYNKIQHISFAFVVKNVNDPEDIEIENIVRFHSNIIIVSCKNFAEFEDSILKLIVSPYWHPLANVIIYYHKKEEREVLAKIFFSLWYYKAINSIIVQYDDLQGTLFVSDYSPYVSENYKLPLDNQFGCWTADKIKMMATINEFEHGFVCVEKCHNVTLHTNLRANNLGTCIGFNTYAVSYTAIKDIRSLKIFEDKSENLHGFTLRAHVSEVEPFFLITEHKNGTYTIHSRDGMVWRHMAQLMNFHIDLTPSIKVMKKPFNLEVNIEQIYSFAYRKGDLYLMPIYVFDLIVVDIDFTFPFKESGVCIMSKRADFETTIFDVKSLEANLKFVMQFICCFFCIWITFSVYKCVENGRLTFDQIGKDLMNAFRNVLLINLHNPPRRESFRIFLTISLWSFFILNFSSQATIISFFTAVKRGKEVETFDDIIEKGYFIEGVLTQDMILPETEERFRIINSKLVPDSDMLGCVKRLLNDSYRFCLMDCSVGRYVKRNMLNEKGEQYLHMAKDRMHSNYLSNILYKHSPMTDRFNKYIMTFFEAGLVKKWEKYMYTKIKDEVLATPLGMDDLKGIFEVYCFSVGFICIIFLLELVIFITKILICNYKT